MSYQSNNIWSGMAGGAAGGAAMGPWGMVVGGLTGAISTLGRKQTNIDAVLPRINASGETERFMNAHGGREEMEHSLEDSLASQYNRDRSGAVAGGQDAGSSGRMAAIRSESTLAKGHEGINKSMTALRSQVFGNWMKMQAQRDAERASMQYAQDQEQTPMQEMIPAIASMWLNNAGNGAWSKKKTTDGDGEPITSDPVGDSMDADKKRREENGIGFNFQSNYETDQYGIVQPRQQQHTWQSYIN